MCCVAVCDRYLIERTTVLGNLRVVSYRLWRARGIGGSSLLISAVLSSGAFGSAWARSVTQLARLARARLGPPRDPLLPGWPLHRPASTALPGERASCSARTPVFYPLPVKRRSFSLSPSEKIGLLPLPQELSTGV